jgi:hypothetical protein
MDYSGPPLEDKCRSSCCQATVTQAPGEPKIDGEATAAHTAVETEGTRSSSCCGDTFNAYVKAEKKDALVQSATKKCFGSAQQQDSGCGKNISDETGATVKDGACYGNAPTRNATKGGCDPGCCLRPSIAAAEEKMSTSISHIDAKVDADCCGSTATLDEDNTTGIASTLTFTTAADKCGTSCCSGSVEVEAKKIEGSSTIAGGATVKAERSQSTGCRDNYVSSEKTPTPVAGSVSGYKRKCCLSANKHNPATSCESDCRKDVLEKEATAQIIAVSSNDGDSDCCAGKKAPCCNGKYPYCIHFQKAYASIESCVDRLTARECEKSSKSKPRQKLELGKSHGIDAT